MKCAAGEPGGTPASANTSIDPFVPRPIVAPLAIVCPVWLQLIDDVGGFAEEKFNAEDHDLVMRIGTAPGFVFVMAPEMIAYRQHPEAATRDLSKTYTGLVHLLQMERAGRYPGGAAG